MAWKVPGYEPLTQVGRGSTGVVVSARDASTGAIVAIKYLSNDVYRARGFAARYRDEISVLDRIEHPHVAQVFELVETDGAAAVVTELVTGSNVRQIIDGCGALDPESALYVLKGALLGLGEAHGRFVAHRDLKPENLILDTTGVVKVLDIGIPAPRRRGGGFGTPRYLAPELWAGQPATQTSDVYAASVILLECLTGRPPAIKGKYLGQSTKPADAAIATVRDLAPPVRALLSSGLARPPLERPADADGLLAELEDAALEAYGPDWEAVGRAKLAYRMQANAARRRGVPLDDDSRPVPARPRPSMTRVLVLAAVLVLLAGAAAFALTGAFGPAGGAAAAPAFSHVPEPATGPTVPPTSLLGSRPDTVKPQPPTGLRMTSRSETAVALDWNPATDNVKVAGYVILRNGHQVGTSFDPGYTDTGLTPDHSYDYTVTAFDAAGNVSAASPQLAVTTLRQPDTAAPSAPTNLHSTGRTVTTIVLAWSPSHDNVGVAGYDIVRDNQVIGSTANTTYTDSGLSGSSTHTYAVRAFDASNNASGNSVPVTVTTLTPPAPTTPPPTTAPPTTPPATTPPPPTDTPSPTDSQTPTPPPSG